MTTNLKVISDSVIGGIVEGEKGIGMQSIDNASGISDSVYSGMIVGQTSYII